MYYNALVEQIRQYVANYFDTHPNPKLLYHGLSHTESVVAVATQISNHYQLKEREYFVVIAAAWFHDVGYLEGINSHEEKSAQKAAAYLTEKGVGQDVIHAIQSTILATKIPQNPQNLMEQIICDADLFHLGTDTFSEQTRLMRKEKEALYNTTISKKEWRRQNIQLLETHQYHTDYSRQMLNETKQKNLEKLKQKAPQGEEGEAAAAPQAPKPDKIKDKKPDRGIETMFRISATNHQRLSDMADNKANIMITVNAIILSVIISVLLRRMEEYPHLTFPSYLLLAVNVITLIFAVLATRPSIPDGTFSTRDIEDKKVNLLFFGNFYRMNLEAYTAGMLSMMSDSDFLYRSLIKDVYSQGVVLGKKYRLLRMAYNVFMYGIIGSVIAFVIASILYRNVY